MSWWERHVVPRLVDVCCGTEEVERLRGPVCAGLHGSVLEIGFGSGRNLPYYPAAVERVVAVEPSDLGWRLSARRRADSGVEVRRGGLDGQRLDLPDESVDCALSTFTMCTIPDLGAALAEIRRVLRPGGRLHFLEHGRAPDPGVARWQRWLEPAHRPLAGGCHLTRDVLEEIEDAGLRTGEVEQFYGAGPRPFSYLTVGWAGIDRPRDGRARVGPPEPGP